MKAMQRKRDGLLPIGEVFGGLDRACEGAPPGDRQPRREARPLRRADRLTRSGLFGHNKDNADNV